jgi:hypothetical protein
MERYRRSIGLFQAMMPAVAANVMGLPAVAVGRPGMMKTQS